MLRQTRIQMLRAETTDELIRILEDCRAMLNHSHDSTAYCWNTVKPQGNSTFSRSKIGV